jgi:integrase
MASIWKNPRSRYWTACWRNQDGKQCRATTKTTDRKLARRMAEEFEKASRNRRTMAQLEKILRGYHEEFGGEGFEKRSLRSFCAEWLAEKEPSVSPATIKFYRKTVQKLLEHFGERADRPIAEVTPNDLVTFRNQLAKEVSASTVNHNLIAVRMIFKAARRLGRIAEDPAEFLKPVREFDNPHQEKRRPFTEPELRALMAAADSEWRSVIRIALYTGGRLSDIATLRWSNVDLERAELSFIARKTRKTVLLPIVGPLLTHIESLPSSDDPHDLLHPRAGEIFYRSNHAATLSAAFGDLLEHAGLRPVKEANSSGRRRANGLSFHSLRHNCVSMLKDAGIPQAVVQEFVGHADAKTSALYTHTGREALEKAATAFPAI